jgi:hypothetical protein
MDLELKKNQTANITDEILNNAGRVSDFTLENFFYNMWLNIAIATVVIIFFTFYRQIRGDKNLLKEKLKDK